jgi:Family of unknown function (DUF6084)
VAELAFECLEARAVANAVSPTIALRLRITDPSPGGVHAIVLRCQLRIEPRQRRYTAAEAELLGGVFGDPSRWGETLHALQFAQVSLMVPGFTGTTEIDLPVPCGYDTEVAAGAYFTSLDEGEIPLLLLFSGTVFARAPGGFTVRPVPWHCEARCRLPVAVWREVMDHYFPGSGWLRLRTETLRALLRFKSDSAIATWDDVVERLLKEAGR